MNENKDDKIQVVVAMDFSDDLIQRLRDISPRLVVERHFPYVPDAAWAKAEVLYTVARFPQPQQAPMLRWIQLHSAGLEHALKEPIMQAEDVLVTSASGIHAAHMANYCLMMILSFHYGLPRMLAYQAQAKWAEPEVFEPVDMRQQTVGIVGYGSIGRELARQLQPLGVKILASKRNIKQLSETNAYAQSNIGDPTGDIPDRLYPADAILSMLAECDYVVVATPLTEETRNLINEEALDAMKETAVLINVARGGVVDEAALVSALAAEKIAGAALDVFEQEPLPKSSPLWNLDNVIISPHVSGNASDYHEKAANLFVANLRRYLENQPLLNQLDRQRGY